MKSFGTYLFIAFMLSTMCAFAQDYSRVDATIKLYPESFNTPEELSKFISRDFSTDDEKVRAIYTWIISNVNYEPEEYKNFDFSFKNYRERNQKEERAREKIIKRTIKKGVAVCEGYAMLFERLCELQGIPNYLVRGDTKSNFQDIGRSFNTNHMWNVVNIDGQNFLFDPTWGAGRFSGKFIKDPSYFYFKTPPKLFFKTHYPEMYEDAFMEQVVPKNVFSSLPLIIDRQLTFDDIEKPISGILTTELLENFQFKIRRLSATVISYAYDQNPAENVNNLVSENQYVQFEIPVDARSNNLLIFFDGKPALGFKVN